MPITGEKNPRNFITKITDYEKVCSIANSMTVLPELLPCVLEMMKKKIIGTVNLTNPGLITHNQILDMYREYVDPDFIYKNFSVEEQNQLLAAERSNNYLDTTKLEKLFPNIKAIDVSIKDMLIKYEQNLNKINLLVTGGCGFIGSNFINLYFGNRRINQLVNLDAMYYCADENNISETIRNNKNYKLLKMNLRDYSTLQKVLEDYSISHVIHFAAQSHVQNSFTESLDYTNDNIIGTHNLLEACRHYQKIKKFVHVSTDEVYGESMNNIKEIKKNEHSILCPTNPYAATKAGAELIAQSYYHSFKLPIIITRGNNVYGANQYPEKIIPKFIKQLKNDEKVTIQGKGTARRSFLHVNDTVSAFENILEKGKIGEIYNIGCDEEMEYTVMEVAKILIEIIKNTKDYDKWITYIEDRPFNDQRYYISNDKVKQLGWNINVSFLDGIKHLIEDKNV